jgi:tight adherence protein B
MPHNRLQFKGEPKALNVVLLVSIPSLIAFSGGGPVISGTSALLLAIAPRLAYRALRALRLRRIVGQLPDAMLSISSNLRSGLGLTQSIALLVEHQPSPLRQELELVLRELRVGLDFADVMDGLHRRVPAPEMHLVTAAMKLSRDIGGNLSDILHRIADTLRRRLQAEGKIRSLTAQGRLQGMVMTGLPVFLVIALMQLEPRAMQHLYSTWYGWLSCAVILILEVIGHHFIRRIVSIDV